MLRLAVRFYGAFLKILYRICCLASRKEKAIFISRQYNNPSIDYRFLIEQIKISAPSYKVIVMCKTCGTGAIERFVYSFWIMRQTYHLATSKICFVDGYNPAVCISPINGSCIVVQIWHALGTMKKFARQTLDTDGGHASWLASLMNMHKNYSWIVAPGTGAVEMYADAFGYPSDRVKPIGLPRADWLKNPHLCVQGRVSFAEIKNKIRERYPELFDRALTNVLYAPTFRRGKLATQTGVSPIEMLSQEVLREGSMRLIVSKHPVSTIRRLPKDCFSAKGFTSSELLSCADVLITDYSAIAFEGVLLGLKVFFYVPDIDDYLAFQGLNVNPEIEFPACTFRDAKELIDVVREELTVDPQALGSSRFDKLYTFASMYLDGCTVGAAERILNLALEDIAR